MADLSRLCRIRRCGDSRGARTPRARAGEGCCWGLCLLLLDWSESGGRLSDGAGRLGGDGRRRRRTTGQTVQHLGGRHKINNGTDKLTGEGPRPAVEQVANGPTLYFVYLIVAGVLHNKEREQGRLSPGRWSVSERARAAIIVGGYMVHTWTPASAPKIS